MRPLQLGETFSKPQPPDTNAGVDNFSRGVFSKCSKDTQFLLVELEGNKF